MTRFKEKRRIELAIKHRNMSELLWALKYCELRFKFSSMKEHEKSWRKLMKQIRATIQQIEDNEDNT